MNWKKLGLIFNPKNEKFWMNSHASVPFAENFGDGLFRIYFSSRDVKNRSYLGSFDIDINKPKKIISISENPILSPGDLGTFDDSGVMASQIITYQQKKFLYYIGWNRGVTVPYRNSIGLAISNDDGKTYNKFSKGPIIDRDYNEPHFSASSYVILEDKLWRMWYVSCVKWEILDNQPSPHYHIKYAESKDGINWKRDGKICINFKNNEEWAISRPFVWKEEKLYKMMFSYRGKNPYKIGYAESSDGIIWKRKDSETGIDVSKKGWDSEMIEYPFIFSYDQKKYLLYNGNDYGKTGIGLAVLES